MEEAESRSVEEEDVESLLEVVQCTELRMHNSAREEGSGDV